MEEAAKKNVSFNWKQFVIWMAALVIGCGLGMIGNSQVNGFCDFIATIYTKLFKFVAVPTIALAVTTTLALLGAKKNTGKIFLHTIIFTLLTTIAAAAVGALLYKVIAPGNLPEAAIAAGQADVPAGLKAQSVYDHILAVVPDNVLNPVSSGNVLSILLVSAAVGLALAMMKQSENIQTLLKGILGLQELLFALIRGLVWALPLGIVAFAAQLSVFHNSYVRLGRSGRLSRQAGKHLRGTKSGQQAFAAHAAARYYTHTAARRRGRFAVYHALKRFGRHRAHGVVFGYYHGQTGKRLYQQVSRIHQRIYLGALILRAYRNTALRAHKIAATDIL